MMNADTEEVVVESAMKTMHNVCPKNMLATGPGTIEDLFIAGKLVASHLEWQRQFVLLERKGIYLDGVLVKGTSNLDNWGIRSMKGTTIHNDHHGGHATEFEAQMHLLRSQQV